MRLRRSQRNSDDTENALHLLRGQAASRHQSKMFLPFSVTLRAFSALSVFRFNPRDAANWHQ